ncbi:hypothetical protein JVT61DRAFT_11696 [Boletus reticuloceps]|uniref:Uncharacterized protein n=1 Tax=Boletus reticuloceps TaxID=495285 RepID=A0A8I2YY01_9AGAM|nr:hypothetical protein JVT61DRAFT_11696 [Boletus reticuloceps]
MAGQGSHAADVEFLVRRSMTKGYQLFSLLTPPAYVAFVLARKGRAQFSINRFLRATWVGGATSSGCAAGGGFEYVRSAYSSEITVRNRHIRSAYDTAPLRKDDHSTIGALLFAVLTPALFWSRASTINCGAGIGSSVGVLTHYGRTLTGDSPPPVEVPEVTISSP